MVPISTPSVGEESCGGSNQLGASDVCSYVRFPDYYVSTYLKTLLCL